MIKICPTCKVRVKWKNKVCGRDPVRECMTCGYKEHTFSVIDKEADGILALECLWNEAILAMEKEKNLGR